MSVEAQAIALHHSRAKTATSKLVLLGIANHDGDGGAWPAISTLAGYAVCSDRTAQRAVDELERLGEVRRVVQGGGTRWTADHRRPNLYEFLLRCPPDCDRTKNHRTRRKAGPTVELDGLDTPDATPPELSTRVTPVSPVPGYRSSPELSTRVTPVSPGGVTPVSPEPVLGTMNNSGTRNQPQTVHAHETWTSACLDGTMSGHALSRKYRRCGYCAATPIAWTETE